MITAAKRKDEVKRYTTVGHPHVSLQDSGLCYGGGSIDSDTSHLSMCTGL